MLIVPRSIPILGCVTLGAWMIFLWQKKKQKTTKPLFNYANKFMTSFSLLISCIGFIRSIDSNSVSSSAPKDIRSHYTRFCEGITESDFLFLPAAGELGRRRLNHSLSWTELFAEHSREGAGLGDPSCLSQGENCFCSHNSHNISPSLASLCVPLRGHAQRRGSSSP